MRVRSREIILLGYYGAGNLGDDLMLRGLVAALLKADPIVIINIVSYYKRPLPVPESPRVRVVRATSLVTKLARLIPLFIRCRLAFFGGGTPFTDSEGDGSYKFFRLAHLLGCRFGYIGVGIGRLNCPKRHKRAVWLLNRCDLATFRDPTSLRRAIELVGGNDVGRMHLTEDLCYLDLSAHLLPRRVTRDATATSQRVLVSWRELCGEVGVSRDAELAMRFTQALRRIAETRSLASVTLLPLDPTVDLHAHQRLAVLLKEALPGVEIRSVTEASLDRVLEIISSADIYMSVRLHGAFIGKVLGVPTISFGYSPKIRYYFDSIGSSSMLTWEELERNDNCLVQTIKKAIVEASTPIDLSSHTVSARDNVCLLLGVLE